MLPDRYIAELAGSLESLRHLARQSDETLARSVPACPGWTLDALFGHVGSIERWAAEVVLHGRFVEQGAPPGEGAAGWFLEGAEAFFQTMNALDPEAPCWNFGPPPRTAGFWLRRQAHEHALHLVDACQAAGLERPDLAEDFMIDGVDEVLTLFAPRQLHLKRMAPPEQAITFRVPDGRAWTLGEGPPAATISASARELYLGLWGRSSLAGVARIEGNEDLAFRVLQGPLTP